MPSPKQITHWIEKGEKLHPSLSPNLVIEEID